MFALFAFFADHYFYLVCQRHWASACAGAASARSPYEVKRNTGNLYKPRIPLRCIQATRCWTDCCRK